MYREIKWFIQGHVVRTRQIWNSDPSLPIRSRGLVTLHSVIHWASPTARLHRVWWLGRSLTSEQARQRATAPQKEPRIIPPDAFPFFSEVLPFFFWLSTSGSTVLEGKHIRAPVIRLNKADPERKLPGTGRRRAPNLCQWGEKWAGVVLLWVNQRRGFWNLP